MKIDAGKRDGMIFMSLGEKSDISLMQYKLTCLIFRTKTETEFLFFPGENRRGEI